jgi:hypothetical protein
MSVPRSKPGGFAARTVVLAVVLLLAPASQALADGSNEVTPLAPFVNVQANCDHPTELVGYIPQDGVAWSPTDTASLTLQPGGSVTSVATPVAPYTFTAGAQTEFPTTNTFDPATMCPTAKPDTFTIWLGHKYDLTGGMLKNDAAPEGCTPQISDAVQTGGFVNGKVTFHKSTHKVTVLSWQQATKPTTFAFNYTYACAETGYTSTPVKDVVTVRPTWKMRVKLLSHHRYKVINRNSTYFWVKTWKPGGHYLLKPFKVKAHSSKIRKRLHVRNVVGAWLGKYKTPMGYRLLRAW